MAANIGAIQVYSEGAFGYPGDESYAVASGTAASISAGTPVAIALGNSTGSVVTAAVTNTPVVGTNYYAGIAATTSTETATLAGTVRVTKFQPGISYTIAPKVAATWNTQALYNALVGARVLLDLTSNVWTILAADGSTNGCVILPLNIQKDPGLVRFTFRNGVNFLN